MPQPDETGELTAPTPSALPTDDIQAPPSSADQDIGTPPSDPEPTTDDDPTLESLISDALNADTVPATPDPDPGQPAPSEGSDPEDPPAAQDPGDKGEADDDPKDPEPVSGTPEPTPSEPEGDEGLDQDPTDDELSKYSARAKKRIEKLLSDRNTARAEVADLQTDADQYRQMRGYMEQNNLEDREVADLFRAGADLKSGDPARLANFIALVEPLLNTAKEATGRAVPQDLAAQVQSGEMTEAAALQLGTARHQAAIAQMQARTATEQTTAAQATEARTQIRDAVSTHIAETIGKSPDYARLQGVMHRVSQGMVAERGAPQSVEDAKRMVDEAWAETQRLMGPTPAAPSDPTPTPPTPEPKPTRPAPAPTSAPRSGVKPEPTSLEQIIGDALNGR
ncbi:MAG: hypothetical protein AAGK37_19225 [Pseudomonadota bacterium]